MLNLPCRLTSTVAVPCCLRRFFNHEVDFKAGLVAIEHPLWQRTLVAPEPEGPSWIRL